MKKTSIPRLISWLFISGIILLLFMTIMRFVFFYRFHAPGEAISNYTKPFLLGLNFDLRIVCGAILFPFLIGNLFLTRNAAGKLEGWSYFRIALTVIIMAALLFFMFKGHMYHGTLVVFGCLFLLILVWLFKTRNCNPFENNFSRKIFKGWFIFVCIVLVLFYAFDFEHYDYLRQRLSASIINFAGDAKISMSMIWETYPVFSLILFILIGTAVLIWLINYSFRKTSEKTFTGRKGSRFILGVIFTLLLALGIFGRVNQYPLRWSDAFSFKDDFKANLALNPVQSFLSTLQFRNSGYDINIVKEYYPLISKYLRVTDPDSATLNFKRIYDPAPGTPKRNVVVVICESFSM